jgi:hypothetical protein
MHQCLGLLLVEVGCLPLLNAQSAGGTDSQAEASAIAQFLAHHTRLPIHDLDGTLGTWCHTCAAAIAEFLINPHNLSNCHTISLD